MLHFIWVLQKYLFRGFPEYKGQTPHMWVKATLLLSEKVYSVESVHPVLLCDMKCAIGPYFSRHFEFP